MLSKQQISDRRECNRLAEKSIDKECMDCSCNVCIAREDAMEYGKILTLIGYIDGRIETLKTTGKPTDPICTFLITELTAIKNKL
jgi:hypothetical protein